MTELDSVAQAVDTYRNAQARIKEWEAVMTQARAVIEGTLGDEEVGTVDGKEAVRWTHVTSNRLDQTLLKAGYPDAFRACQTPSTSRRFVLVES